MKKLISVRLEEEDYAKLLAVAKPFGGVGKWISNMLGGVGGSPAKANPLPPAQHIPKEVKKEVLKKAFTDKDFKPPFALCKKCGVMNSRCVC